MRTVIAMGKTHDECFQGELAGTIPYHRMNGKEYCVPAFIAYSQEELQQLRTASEAVHRIYWKVLRFTQRYLPDEFIAQYLGVDPALIPLARKETPGHGIARLDWIINEQGIKCIENNCDTPTGVPEVAFAANEMLRQFMEARGEESAGSEYPLEHEHALAEQTAAEQLVTLMDEAKRCSSSSGTCGYISTSSDMDELIGTAFAKLVEHYRRQGADGSIVFTSFDWHAEDRANTEYIMACLQSKGYKASYVPLAELELIPDQGLYANGEQISILYRLYPLEYIVHDVDETGSRNIGLDLLRLVEQGKLYLINPEQSILMQSKGFMALIWSLYERRDETEQYCGFALFDDEDMRNIEQYLLPTYFEDSVFVQQGLPYVAKGIWGREGKGTAIYEADEQQQSGTGDFSMQHVDTVAVTRTVTEVSDGEEAGVVTNAIEAGYEGDEAGTKAAEALSLEVEVMTKAAAAGNSEVEVMTKAAAAMNSDVLVSAATDQEDEDAAAELDYYNNQSKIYQHYYPLQRVQIDTEDGAYSGYLLTGAFLVDGQFAGLLPRVGEKVTGDMAYFCPAVVTD